MGFFVSAYFVLRYGGLWIENDTAVFSQITSQMLHYRSVLFLGQYVHGFGYPAWMGSLSLLSGVSVPILDTIVLPFAGMLFLIVSTYVLYGLVLKHERHTMLAVLLLFAVPDLLFTVVRGNHEKLNVFFMVLALFSLIKGYKAISCGDVTSTWKWIGLFYVQVFINATVNDYFGSTFAAAAAATFLSGVLLQGRVQNINQFRPQVLRYSGIVAVSWLMVLWVMLYVFPPAGADLGLAHSALQKFLNLFLTLHTSSNPYVAPTQQWAGKAALALVSAFRWILFLTSFTVWARDLVLLFTSRRRYGLSYLFLLGLYGSFGFLVFAAIPLDFTGLNAGTNLEVRNFPYYALVAAPLMALGINRLLSKIGNDVNHKVAHRVRGSLGVIFSLFVVVSLLKVTLDPLMSNLWMYFTPAESQALRAFWQESVYTTLWAGPDNRLVYVADAWFGRDPGSNQVAGYGYQTTERDLLISAQVIQNSLVQNFTIPNYSKQNLIYNDGGAEIYRMAPQTPFEN